MPRRTEGFATVGLLLPALAVSKKVRFAADVVPAKVDDKKQTRVARSSVRTSPVKVYGALFLTGVRSNFQAVHKRYRRAKVD